MSAASSDDSTDEQEEAEATTSAAANAIDGRKGFERKLRRVAQAIRKEAAGRKCGSCSHWSQQGCEHTAAPLDDSSHAPHHAEAVACKRWEERKQQPPRPQPAQRHAAPSRPSPCSPTPPLLPSVYRSKADESIKK